MKNIRFPRLVPNCVRATFAIAATSLLFSATARAVVTWDGDQTPNLNWSTTGNWNTGAIPISTDDVSFTDVGGATSGVTSNVDQNFTIRTLNFTGLSATTQQRVQIDTGITLSITSTSGAGVVLGVGNQATGGSSTVGTRVAISGNAMTVNGANQKTISVSNAAAGEATLDMSGLSTFTSTSSNIYIGTISSFSSNVNNIRGRIILAQNSTMTSAGTLGIAGGGSNSSGNVGVLEMGQTTALNVGSISVGSAKSNGSIVFQDAITDGAVTIRGATGGNSYVSSWLVGSNGVAGNADATGKVDLRRGSLDANVTTLSIGQNTGNNSNPVIGSMKYSSGNVNVTNLTLGTQTAVTNQAQSSSVTGTMKVGGDATLVVGTLNMANSAGTVKTANGTLQIDGGSVTVNTAMTLGSTVIAPSPTPTPTNPATVNATVSITNGGSLTVNAASGIQAMVATSVTQSNTTITLDGGTLNMTGKAIGSSTNAIDNVNFLSGTAVNLGTINGTGGLTKTGNGALTVSGTSGYTGGTSVLGGVVSFASDSAIPAAASVTATSGAVAFGYSSNLQSSLTTYVTTGSTGSLALMAGQGGQNIDFTGYAGMHLGAYGDVTYTGTYTPASAGVYRLGGGTGTLTYANNLTGSESVVIGGGNGTVVLSGANTYTGSTTINAGTLELTNIDDLGSSTALNFGGGTIQFGAGVNDDLSAGGRTLTFNAGAAGFDTNGNDVTFANGVGNSGAGGLTKDGEGILTLQGANSYTGATTVNRGTLAVDLSGGNNRIATTSALTLGGGTLKVTGATGVASTQTLGNVTLTASSASRIVIDPAASTSTTLTLGNTWTRGAQSTLHIDRSLGGTVTSNPSASATNGVIRYATVNDGTGIGFAAISGGNVVRYTSGNGFGSGANGSTTNYAYTASASPLSMSNSGSYSSLSIDASTAGGGIDYNGFIGSTQALLVTGTQGFVISNGTFGTSAAELIVHQYSSGTLDISAAVSGSSGSLTKAGTGVLRLSGTSTYTGNTVVSEGTLLIDGRLDSNVTVNQGATLGGEGRTSESITVNSGGSIAPGAANAMGTLSADNLTWNGNGTLKFQLGGGSASDSIALTGVFVAGLDGAYAFDFLGTGVDGGVYTLLTFNNSTFTSASQFSYINMAPGTGGTFTLNENSLVFTAVPEPGTMALLATGLGVVFMLRRRSRKA